MQKFLKYWLLAVLGLLLGLGWHAVLTAPALSAATRSSVELAAIPSNQLATYLEADRLYRQGDVAGAEKLYREVKPEFPNRSVSQIIDPIYEPSALDAADLAYWNSAQTAIAANNSAGAIVSLEQLFESAPGFILAPLELAKQLQQSGRNDEAIAVLDQAATIHPYSAEIVMAQALALAEAGLHVEASIAAREFALLNPDHPQVGEFEALANDQLNIFLNSQRNNNIVGGAVNILGGILLGNNPWDSWDSAMQTYEIVDLALSDESEFGAKAAEQYKQQLPLVDDPEIVDYVTQLGLEVAQLMGRDFDYEFFVVQDSSLNAFALPGGKIFVNTGAIAATNSQAELAGVLAHEVSHSVLSHGMQQLFTNNLLAQFQSEIPLGEFVTTLVSLNYSREQERQSDILGTRVLATAGYAADGLRNFMATLAQNTASTPTDEYFSTHPASAARVSYLEELIQRNGYNRYALEGVDRHREIQAKLG